MLQLYDDVSSPYVLLWFRYTVAVFGSDSSMPVEFSTLSVLKLVRFSEVNELIKMNAKIIRHKNKIIIFPSRLIGTTVTATDLRAGFALIVAGANAAGVTIIENAQVIFRGYEHLILKLKNLNINAKIIL